MPITFTTSPTTKTVKPTQTTFTNKTGKAITLRYQGGSSDSVAVGGQVTGVSKTIQAITYNATTYYPATGNYTIPAKLTVPINVVGQNLVMGTP